MSLKRLLAALLPVLATLLVAGSVAAADLAGLVANLVTGGYSERDAAITALAASGEARAAPILQALGAGELYVRNADKLVVIGKGSGKQLALTDAITGKDAGTATEDDLDRVKINNRLRGTLDAVDGLAHLDEPRSQGPPRRRRRRCSRRREPGALEALDKAIAAEKDNGIKRAMVEARASVVLASDAPGGAEARGDRRRARSRRPRRDGRAAGRRAIVADGAVKAAATAAADSVRQSLAAWAGAQNVWYGISLGSVLLLAAIGLAITFGTMGVINMAHGEMVMLGAYTTFVVQQVIRSAAPAASTNSPSSSPCRSPSWCRARSAC